MDYILNIIYIVIIVVIVLILIMIKRSINMRKITNENYQKYINKHLHVRSKTGKESVIYISDRIKIFLIDGQEYNYTRSKNSVYLGWEFSNPLNNNYIYLGYSLEPIICVNIGDTIDLYYIIGIYTEEQIREME